MNFAIQLITKYFFMKKQLTFVVLLLFSTSIFAQNEWKDKTRILPEELRNIPVGIFLSHSPNPNYPILNDSTEIVKNKYLWKHSTFVQSIDKDLEVIKAGSYVWFSEKGWFNNIQFDNKMFSEKFNCKNGYLKKDIKYCYEKNYRFGNNLFGGDALWYIIAKDKEGLIYKGISLIETEAKLLENENNIEAQNKFNLHKNDIQNLIGYWEGTLTYLDYTSGKPFTMNADLSIETINKSNDLIFSNIYAKESSANSKDTITISKKMNYINNLIIKSRKKLDNDKVEIITQELSIDGNENKQALIKHTIIIGKTKLIKRKDVKFIDENVWINRYEYSYIKKHSK